MGSKNNTACLFNRLWTRRQAPSPQDGPADGRASTRGAESTSCPDRRTERERSTALTVGAKPESGGTGFAARPPKVEKPNGWKTSASGSTIRTTSAPTGRAISSASALSSWNRSGVPARGSPMSIKCARWFGPPAGGRGASRSSPSWPPWSTCAATAARPAGTRCGVLPISWPSCGIARRRGATINGSARV